MSREISKEEIREAVYKLCLDSLFKMRDDIREALEEAYQLEEEGGAARLYIQHLLKNAEIAEKERLPLTTENNVPVFFAELGSEICIEGGSIRNAVEEGLQLFIQREPFRYAVLRDPLNPRKLLADRLPSLLHLAQSPGDSLKIRCLRIDAESERVSRTAVFSPEGLSEAIEDFLLHSILEAQLRISPPLFIGIGIGGSSAEVPILARKAILRRMGKPSSDLSTARFERELLHSVNRLGIGPGGIGGKTTALAVQIETLPSPAELVPVSIQLLGSVPCIAEVVL